jgi:hypothetical protein
MNLDVLYSQWFGGLRAPVTYGVAVHTVHTVTPGVWPRSLLPLKTQIPWSGDA